MQEGKSGVGGPAVCHFQGGGRLALAVPACGNDAPCPVKLGISGDAGSEQCAWHVLEGAWSREDPASSHFRPLQLQAARLLVPSCAGPASFGKQFSFLCFPCLKTVSQLHG